MLRAVAFQNFIKFRKHQSLTFENGPNFVVGPNASGKSAIFELVRRCLSNTANDSASSVPNETLPAFVICKFEQELPGKPGKRHVYSCVYIKPPANDSPRESIKFVCVRQLSEENKPGRNETKEECYLDHYHHFDDRTETQTFRNSIDTLSEDLDSLIDGGFSLCNLDNLITKIKGDTQQTESVFECEPILRKIHDAVVVTFPLRSPGPIQWSHSESIGTKNDNYEMASNKAEILQALLEPGDIKRDRIFETLIQPLKYHFKKDTKDSPIIVNDGEKDIPLLKVPVGIIEAKQFSLMFAHGKFHTLLLEEPDRGMHPHMIHKLRDLVFRTRSKDPTKVLVITTHQTTMINQWSMSRMFICRRIENKDGTLEHCVAKLRSDIQEIYELEDTVKELVFSEYVLFVEGFTDKKVIRSVFDRVLEDDSEAKFHEMAAKTQIIFMGGSTDERINKHKRISEELKVPYTFLVDRDKHFDCKAEVQPKTAGSKWRNQASFCARSLFKRTSECRSSSTEADNFFHVMNMPTENNNKQVKDVVGFKDLNDVKTDEVVSFIRRVVLPKPLPEEETRKLEEANFYTWKSGNIEDVICISILGDQTEGMEPDEGLLRNMFLCKDSEGKGKNAVKERLKEMDIETARKVSTRLLKYGEMKQFLEFLLIRMKDFERLE